MRPIVVLGLMGAGKSTVAGAVATATGRPLRDSDLDIAAGTGEDAAAIATRSVEALHRLEADHLLDALDDPAAVVAAAASVVDEPACRTALVSRADVVWLDVPVDVLATRFDSGPHRPVYGTDTHAVLAAQHARRVGYFTAVADLRLDAHRPVSEIVTAVLALATAGSPSGPTAPTPTSVTATP